MHLRIPYPFGRLPLPLRCHGLQKTQGSLQAQLPHHRASPHTHRGKPPHLAILHFHQHARPHPPALGKTNHWQAINEVDGKGSDSEQMDYLFNEILYAIAFIDGYQKAKEEDENN